MAFVIGLNILHSVECVQPLQDPWIEQLRVIKETCKEAGDAILDLRERGLISKKVTLPNGKEVLQTNADIAASEAIIARLAEAHPLAGFVSQDQMEKDLCWYEKQDLFLINPIDNTKEFEANGDDFHIQIGFMHQAEVVVGVSYYPATRTFIWAVKGQGAFRQTGDGETTVLTARRCEQNVLLKSSSIDAIGPHFPEFEVVDRHFSSTSRLLDMIEGHSNLYISLGASPSREGKKGGRLELRHYPSSQRRQGLCWRTAGRAQLICAMPMGYCPRDLLTSDPALLDRVVTTFQGDF